VVYNQIQHCESDAVIEDRGATKSPARATVRRADALRVS
jgi:hypothetical protein